MTSNTNFKRFTGNYIFKKKFLGYNIMLECIGTYTDWNDFQESSEFTYWKKAEEADLVKFDLKLK